jgi:hypothetical protein
VDGPARKLAKAGGKKKVHLPTAVTHVTGLVLGPGQSRQGRQGRQDHALQAAAGTPAPERRGHHRRRVMRTLPLCRYPPGDASGLVLPWS